MRSRCIIFLKMFEITAMRATSTLYRGNYNLYLFHLGNPRYMHMNYLHCTSCIRRLLHIPDPRLQLRARFAACELSNRQRRQTERRARLHSVLLHRHNTSRRTFHVGMQPTEFYRSIASRIHENKK